MWSGTGCLAGRRGAGAVRPRIRAAGPRDSVPLPGEAAAGPRGSATAEQRGRRPAAAPGRAAVFRRRDAGGAGRPPPRRAARANSGAPPAHAFPAAQPFMP